MRSALARRNCWRGCACRHLLLTALAGGAAVVQINPDRTDLDDLATFQLRGTAARILPELVRQGWPEVD